MAYARGLVHPAWLDPSELRIGLGCMRLSTDDGHDDRLAVQTIAAAAEAGITVFDTAHAYGRGEAGLGENVRLLTSALRGCGAQTRARIVTKGGMTRVGGAWVPDGRAKAILSDCEASLVALDGLPIDVYLIHAPDPRTPWPTSVRALGRLLDEGMVARVGVSNVNRRQLDEALELGPIAAVEIALSPQDDRAIRGGIVERCAELGVPVLAHSPFGGPRRAKALARAQPWIGVAAAHGVTPGEAALAWLLELWPGVVALPGARRPDTARGAARAAKLVLSAEDRLALGRAFAGFASPRHEPPRAASPRREPQRAATHGEVVVIMGIPGAGKSRAAQDYITRGYVRLNRDERGGALREVADAVDRELSAGARRIVLDNTYLTRAARSYVIEAAGRHGVPIRCLWLNTPLAQAQINLVQRLLDRFGVLPTPEELRRVARREAGLLAPTSQMRALRELEPPSTDEGLASVELISFVRAPAFERLRPGAFVVATALRRPGWQDALEAADPASPHLIFHWSPDGPPEMLDPDVAQLSTAVSGSVQSALCPHPAGPPTCWCRPPLPGLPMAFAREHGVDPARSVLIGTGPAHRTLAGALGARYIPV